ncbi:hypothetical protein ACOZFM_28830 [Streptomyces arboris]|uniref:hypothetical protein n=1 Tax=Streptomyces arboris TaxID=2600619 RepID=UPI003BF5013F
MARHRRPASPGAVPTVRTRGQLAACLLGVSALLATLLAATVEPAAPPAPDRTRHSGTTDVARLPE